MTPQKLIVAIFHLSGCKTWFEFSQKAGKSNASISQVKNGQRDMMFSTFVGICQNTGVSLTKAIKTIAK